MASLNSKAPIMVTKTLLNEIWIHVFSFLNPLQLISTIAPVCKLFYELSNEEQIWKQFLGNVTWVSNQIEKYNKKMHSDGAKIIIGKSKNYSKKLYYNWLSTEISVLIRDKSYHSLAKAIDNLSWLEPRYLKITFFEPDENLANILNSANISEENTDVNFNINGETVAVKLRIEFPYESRTSVYNAINYVARASDALVFFGNNWTLEAQNALKEKPEIYTVAISDKQPIEELKVQGHNVCFDYFKPGESKNVLQDIVTNLRKQSKARYPKFSPTKIELSEILTRKGYNISKRIRA